MSNNKSYWFEGDQKGDFSNEGQDTFDPKKGYMGIRLQQGVPLLDRDWNELEDIRRYAEVMLRRHYVGSGTPDEDSFKITATDPPSNDFRILAGRCLVNGFEAVNQWDDNGNEIEYILYSQQDLPALTVPDSDKTYIVYLDVWIEEIRAANEEDPLKNPQDVKMETCVRHKLEWKVRVAEESQGYTPGDFHHYYDIAKINRTANNANITGNMIEDTRRTNLTLYQLRDIIDALTTNVDTHNHSKLVAPAGSPDPALMVDNSGNVGIGTSTPESKLQIVGGTDAGPAAGGSLILGKISGENLALDNNEIMARNNKKAAPLYMQAYGGDLFVNSSLESKKKFVVKGNGNVGIGTSTPEGKLQIVGGEDAELAAGGFLILGEISGTNVAIDDNEIMARKNKNAVPLYLQARGGGLVVHSGQEGKQFAVTGDGNVGIGTNDPQGRLHLFRYYSYMLPKPGGGWEFVTVPVTDFIVKKRYFGSTSVGIGTDDPTHTLQINGDLHVRNWGTVGSDYAEYFQSKNGKAIPAGTAVVLENGKVRRANKNETPVGIISANPGGVSGVHVEWPKKYLRDDFGNMIIEEYKEEIMVPKKEKVKKERQKVTKKKVKEKVIRTEIVEKKGKYCQVEIEETIEKDVEEPIFKEVDLYYASGKNKIGKHKIPVMETYEEEIDVKDENGQPVMIGSGKFETKTRPKINPEYDETKEYIPREKRPEWNCVGLLGQIPLRKGQPVAPTWVKIKDISNEVELWLVK